MIDLPLNKALAPVEVGENADCKGCAILSNCRDISCRPEKRKDGKNVIFKLIDLPEKT